MQAINISYEGMQGGANGRKKGGGLPSSDKQSY
jgi:hypothetical protein